MNKYDFVSCLVWVSVLVSDIKVQNRLHVRKWDVEEEVWAKKGVTGKRLEKTAP
jgi:hypothetical protein